MITSLQNPKVKHVVRLRYRKERNQSGLFLIEGYRELLRASEGNISCEQLFICEDLFLGTNEKELIDALDTEVLECTPEVFHKISYRDRPDGLLAIAKQMQTPLSALAIEGEDALVVVAESIEKPGNLGTILRSCDAVNCDGVLVVDRCTDIYNPNVVRASTGTLFTRPVIESASEETLSFLKENGFTIIAATPHAKKLFTETPLKGRIAIVVGTEQLGLTPFWLEKADIEVKIPMLGTADSLNVATATTLLLYEVLRQRNGS